MRKEFYTQNITGSKLAGKKWHSLRMDAIVDIINKLSVKSALDIGAGSGTILSRLDVLEKTALEINPHWVNKLKEIPNINVVEEDFLKDNLFDENQFELILATEFLEHFPYYDLIKILQNVHKSTNKYFVVCVPNPLSLIGRLAALFGKFKWQQVSVEHAFIADKSQWTELFEANGFSVEKFTGASMKIPKIIRNGLFVTKPIKNTLADFLIFVLLKK